MEIRIFDLSNTTGKLRRIGLTRLTTGHYVKSKYEAGAFEITLPLSAPYANEFFDGRVVLIDGKWWGVVIGAKVDRSSLSDSITVSGSQLKEWLYRRQIVPATTQAANMPLGYDSVAGSTETVIKHYVNNHAVDPVNPNRKIHGLTIADDHGRGIADDAYHARYVNLLETICDIGKRANLGFDITGNESTGLFTFDVIERRDRTHSQTERMPLILEMSRRNIDSLNYAKDSGSSGNVFYCSRAGDEYEWETLTQTYFMDSNEPTGFMRREKSLSISVYEEGNQYQQLEVNARKEMENYREAESVTCVMSRRLEFGKDYLVGDYVTVIDKDSGVMADMEIDSVDTIVSETGINYVATFGTQQLNRFQIIKRDMRARV